MTIERPSKRAASLLFLALLVAYLANLRSIGSGDTIPATLVPLSLLSHGDVVLDQYDFGPKDGPLPYYVKRTANGKNVTSLYPVLTPLLATPFYLPAKALVPEAAQGAPSRAVELLAPFGKLAAAVFAALSAVLLLFALGAFLSPGRSLFLAFAYGLGTSTFSVSSQALWSHAVSQLLLAGLLLIGTKTLTPSRLAAAGLLAALMLPNRPPDLLLVVPIAVFFVVSAGRRAGFFLGPAILVSALGIAANLALHGNLLGGYGKFGALFQFGPKTVLPNLAALLVSPVKGLFVFSPFLLASLVTIVRLRKSSPPLLLACAASFLLHTGMLATWNLWHGGWTYGPRLLAGALPALTLLAAPFVATLPVGALRLFGIPVALSMLFHAAGAYCAPRGSSGLAPRYWSSFPPAEELRAGLASPSFLPLLSSAFGPRPPWGDGRASFPGPAPRVVGHAGEPQRFALLVRNESSAPWWGVNGRDGQGLSFLRVEVKDAAGGPVGGVVFWPLPYRIGPGETSRLTPYAILPPGPGGYTGVATLQGPGFTAESSTRFEVEVLPWDR
ncbi:MAG: hypothetical protein JNK60_00490 [Acidobacteria bacterium]|nr:hypothetical protein [Acidobacteriota bacterium]